VTKWFPSESKFKRPVAGWIPRHQLLYGMLAAQSLSLRCPVSNVAQSGIKKKQTAPWGGATRTTNAGSSLVSMPGGFTRPTGSNDSPSLNERDAAIRGAAGDTQDAAQFKKEHKEEKIKRRFSPGQRSAASKLRAGWGKRKQKQKQRREMKSGSES